MSGNALAQLVSILVVPLLTYLFTPTDMGVLATFVALSGWLGVIAALRYDLAIMLPKSNEDANRLAKMALRYSVIVGLVFCIPAVLLNDGVRHLLEPANNGKINLAEWHEEFRIWLYLVPVSIMLVGINSTLTQWQTRKKSFKRVSAASVSRNVGNASFSLTSGYMGAGAGGLIGSYIFSQLVNALVIMGKGLKQIFATTSNRDENRRLLREYKDFPLKSGPAILLNLTAYQLPIILIGVWFGAQIAGQYYVTMRILNAPLTFIGKAFSQVFFQRSNELLNQGKPVGELVKKTTLRLVAIIIVPMILLFFFGEELFGWVFDEEYGEAGKIAATFSIFYLFRFVFSAQSTMLTSKRKMTAEILFNAAMVISQVGGLAYGYYLGDYNVAFRIMAISGALLFLILGGLIFKYANED